VDGAACKHGLDAVLAIERANRVIVGFGFWAEEAIACFGALRALAGPIAETSFTADTGIAYGNWLVGAAANGSVSGGKPLIKLGCGALWTDDAAIG
jgi:hypothetical protein